jgi:predicted ferric reductase
MKLIGFFALVGAMGALAGARYGGDIAAVALPDAGSHGAWYASRASGVASYLCVWVGLMGGLLMSSAWFDGLVGRAKLLAIHQSASITGVALGLGHALVLIPDGWTQFTPTDLFVPFASYYKPLPTAAGTLTLYLAAVVTFSFWFRSIIGVRTWKLLHYASFAVFGGALWHGVKIGTDAGEPWLLGIYLATSMIVVFSLVVRITYIRPSPRRRTNPKVATTA